MNLENYQQRIKSLLLENLPQNNLLAEAMRYSVLNGGKRFRAALIYACGADFNLDFSQIDKAAMAIEAIHAYSLVHDDLPAMDDDDFRRGQPSCHKKFDEATAILCGDALQVWGLAQLEEISAFKILAQATQDMILGQSLDIAATNKTIKLEELQHIHRLKTGALIKASLLLGALPSKDFSNFAEVLHNLGETLGVAYQIQDDILDFCSDSKTLGKTAGKDAAADKATYVQLLGLEISKNYLEDKKSACFQLLQQLPNNGINLKNLLEILFARSF